MFKKGKLEKKICQTRFKFVWDFETGPKKAHYAARRAVHTTQICPCQLIEVFVHLFT